MTTPSRLASAGRLILIAIAMLLLARPARPAPGEPTAPQARPAAGEPPPPQARPTAAERTVPQSRAGAPERTASQSPPHAAPQSRPAAAGAGKTDKKATPAGEAKSGLTSETLAGLAFRNIGPAIMSGRISDIAIHPTKRQVWYVAVGSGGVWKTENAGVTWTPNFDKEASHSIGCLTTRAATAGRRGPT